MTTGTHGTMKVGGKTVKAWTITPPEPPPVSAYDRPEWLAFLRAILAEPGEDVHRLVAADWLEEHGEPERAEFIRASVGEEKLTHAAGAGGCRRCKLERVVCRWIERAGKEGVANLLGCDASTMWYGRRVIVYRPESNAFATRFARGFIEHITCTAADWLAHADSLVWCPEQTVGCPECVTDPPVGWYHKGGCPVCSGAGRVARPFVPTAHPITKVTLTSLPEVLTFDHGLRMFHFEGRETKQFPGLWDSGFGRPEVCKRLLSAYWPRITFTLPPA